MTTAEELYEKQIRGLPVGERLRIAAMILNDLAGKGAPDDSYAPNWSDEDLADLTAYSINYGGVSAGSVDEA